MPHYDCWTIAKAVMPHSPRILLYGVPGTGKTHLAQTAARQVNEQVFSITCTDDQASTDLMGCYSLRDREMIWVDGVATSAWRFGARLVLNEIDRASPEVMTLLHAILDDPEFAQLTLPTGETIKPTTGFRAIATMNGEPGDLPEALQSRFPISIYIDDVHPDALKALPADLRSVARKLTLAIDRGQRISMRTWYEYAKLRGLIGAEVAAKACFGARAQELLDAYKIAAPYVTFASSPRAD